MKIDLTVAGYLFHKGKLLLVHHKKLGIWIPCGGHIEPNETPDQAIKREFKEELNLDITLDDYKEIPKEGNITEECAVPFYCNVHNVGDHEHYCLFYRCSCKEISQLKHNEELLGCKWFSIEELDRVPADVRNIALLAQQ